MLYDKHQKYTIEYGLSVSSDVKFRVLLNPYYKNKIKKPSIKRISIFNTNYLNRNPEIILTTQKRTQEEAGKRWLRTKRYLRI